MIECPVSLGELVDKISILEIKKKKIHDREKLSYVEFEWEMLVAKLKSLRLRGVRLYLEKLIDINLRLWEVEELIRDKEMLKEFDEEFIHLARQVYRMNDKRFTVKNEINHKYDFPVKEVKSFKYLSIS